MCEYFICDPSKTILFHEDGKKSTHDKKVITSKKKAIKHNTRWKYAMLDSKGNDDE